MQDYEQTIKYFGKEKKVFSLFTYNCLLSLCKCERDYTFERVKKYFLSYYAKSLGGSYYYYEPQEDGTYTILNITSREMDLIFRQFKVVYYHEEDKRQASKFSLKDFMTQDVYLTLVVNADPRQPMFYESKVTEQWFINLSKGFLHKELVEYKSFEIKIRRKVKLILKHIKDVWNSGNEEAYEYVLNWLSCALTGHKQETALFLKSGEGTGKSMIIEFINEFVIGRDLGMSTTRAGQLMKFNSQLLGKIFLCLEELPSQSKHEWFSISDFLKDLITGKQMEIEKKFKDSITTVNNISLVVLTNNENSIKFGNEIRRYFMCDISHDKVGKFDYYNTLSRACTNKEVGYAMFCYLSERYEKIKDTFKCNVMPITLSKIEMKTRNLSDLQLYFKNKYVMLSKGDEKLFIKNLVEENNFGQHATVQNLKKRIEHELNGIKIIKDAHTRQHYLSFTHEEIFNYFKKKEYLSEEEIETIEVKEGRTSYLSENEKIEILEKKIKKLKMKLSKYE